MVSHRQIAARMGQGACALALLVAGCAPQYQQRTVYEPPATPEGQQCVAQAQSVFAQCSSEANARFQSCETIQMQAAEPRFRVAQQQYAFDQQIYFQCRNSVLQEIELLNRQREAECRRLAEAGTPCAPGSGFITSNFEIDRRVDTRCREPRQPDLEDFVDLGICGDPMGVCSAQYDSAYQTCGGRVSTVTECVANCE